MKEIIFLALIIISILFLSIHSLDGREDELFSKIGMIKIAGNQKSPEFSLKDMDGKKIAMKHFRGKVILLNFWATWCTPCREEMSSLEWLQNHFEGKDFIFLAISVDYGGVKAVQEFMNKHQYNFLVLLDPHHQVYDLFKVQGIPTTFLIDKRGVILGKAIGPRDWRSEMVVNLLNQFIEK